MMRIAEPTPDSPWGAASGRGRGWSLQRAREVTRVPPPIRRCGWETTGGWSEPTDDLCRTLLTFDSPESCSWT